MRKWVGCALLAAVVIFTMASGAQGHEKREVNPQEVQDRINMIRLLKLTQVLKLDPETLNQVVPILVKYDNDWTSLSRKRSRLLRELRAGLGADEPDPQTLARLSAEYEENRKLGCVLRNRESAALQEVLTDEQWAQFIVFQQEFDNELKEIMLVARRRAVSGGSRVRPGTPGEADSE